MSLGNHDLQRPTLRHRSAPVAADRTRCAALFRTAGVLLSLLLALTAVPQTLHAQGFPGGGGGMGGGRGRGGGGGRGGGRPGGEASGQRGPSSDDVAKQFEELASLDRALRDVPDLDRQKKDSLKAIEDSYARIFKSYSIVARNKADSARAAGGTMDIDELRSLRADADSVRSRELVLARAVLTTDEQRARFDGNVADIRAEEAKRQDQRRSRRGAGVTGSP